MKNRLLILMTISLLASPATAEKQLLWGDTHVHTYYSTDSYVNQNFLAGPDTAYRYAKGLPVVHPTTGARIQIETPLDFLVVADHAESFGTWRAANTSGFPRDDLGPVDWLKSWFIEKMFAILANNPDNMSKIMKFAFPDTDNPVEAAKNPASIPIPNNDLIRGAAWRESIATTDSHNTPGAFTAFIGWEWSSIPGGANLHRVVFTDGDASAGEQFLPLSSSRTSYPEDLWQWLEQTSAETGADFIAIPHNSNISRGYMFPAEKRLRDTPIDREWIEQRARWEPVVEVTQIKGDSETDPALSPDDRFAEFETYPHYIFPTPIPWNPGEADFARSALKTGLAMEQEFGSNPYRFGMIGATDSHTGLPTAEERNFWGKFPIDSVMEGKTMAFGGIETFGWAMSASGLAGVWAEDNTREAIFDAFKRREVYATTGPRIGVRLYGSTSVPDLPDDQAPDMDVFRAAAVPMGGEISRATSSPAFYVEASHDPRSAYLDRIQIIKGWYEGGLTFEKVYDVAWSGPREREDDGTIAPVTDSVDPVSGQFSNDQGAPTLEAFWTDPEFDPSQPAFYYARVLEIPTPRHSTLDAIAMGIPAAQTGYPESIQERAYTSPIHYNPR